MIKLTELFNIKQSHPDSVAGRLKPQIGQVISNPYAKAFAPIKEDVLSVVDKKNIGKFLVRGSRNGDGNLIDYVFSHQSEAIREMDKLKYASLHKITGITNFRGSKVYTTTELKESDISEISEKNKKLIQQYKDKLAKIKPTSPAAKGMRAAIEDDIAALQKEGVSEDVFILWADRVSDNLPKAIKMAKYKGKAGSWSKEYKQNASNGYGTVFFITASNVADAKEKLGMVKDDNKTQKNVYVL